MNDLYGVIGSKIREARKNRRLSLEELAELSAMTPSFLGQIERGERKLSIGTMQKIARAMSIHPGHFLRDGQMDPPASWEQRMSSLLRNQPEKNKALIFKILKFILRALRR